MIHCNHCGKDAVSCNCEGMSERLKKVATASQLGLVTDILAARQKIGKDLPRQCCKEGCHGDPMFIPVVRIPARMKFKSQKTVWITAELLNSPLCQAHKESVRLSDFFDSPALDAWARHCHMQKLRTPAFDRAELTFRPLVITPIVIAP